MDKVNQYDDFNFRCSDCALQFGAIPDMHGNAICPLCKKVVCIRKKLDGITRINNCTYQCDRCNLTFSVTPEDTDQIRCPLCPKNQDRKEGGKC